MGLGVEVGIMADLLENDDESFEHYEEQFAAMNELLAERDLPQHNEPSQVDEVVSYDMWGYSGLQYLRRFAAHIADGGKVPSPGDEQASVDPILQKYFQANEPIKCRFQHLLQHSDIDGYYLPIDFKEVIFLPEDSEITGGMLGSSIQLLEECKDLAKELKLPEDIDPDGDEIWEAAEKQSPDDEVFWKRYGVESFTCVRLMNAARVSVETNAAIIFV